MQIEAVYDKSTGALTYVIYDEASGDTIVIDPVLDCEPRSSSTATASGFLRWSSTAGASHGTTSS